MRLPTQFLVKSLERLNTALGETFSVQRGQQDEGDGDEPLCSLILNGANTAYPEQAAGNGLATFLGAVVLQASFSRFTEAQLWDYFNPAVQAMEESGWEFEQAEYMIDQSSKSNTRNLVIEFRILSIEAEQAP